MILFFLSNMNILYLPKNLFWDTDYERIDPNFHSWYIVTKVFDYGSWDDVKEVIAYYGEEKVKEFLQKASYLRDNALNLACSLFNLKPKDFKCYIKKLSQPNW